MIPVALAISHILGLPAHPLLVHGAVVLVPLGAVAFVIAGLREAWRRAYYLPATIITVTGGVFAFLSKESGEPLSKSIRATGQRVGEHPEQGDTAFVFAMLSGRGLCVCIRSAPVRAPAPVKLLERHASKAAGLVSDGALCGCHSVRSCGHRNHDYRWPFWRRASLEDKR